LRFIVFNGDSSSLYVDGVREGDASSTAGGLTSSSGRGGGGTNVGTGFLDGLTIGADHRNDFPLGSMIEGTVPGAVAELVVFNSVLTPADRSRIEGKLMVSLPAIKLSVRKRVSSRNRDAKNRSR
jgi:hypothetical protein